MVAEWDAQEYARKRQDEYPSVQELVVGLYDESDKEAIVAKRVAVKLKYPKP